MTAVITEPIVAESGLVDGIGSDYETTYGFHAPEDYFFKSGRELSAGVAPRLRESVTKRLSPQGYGRGCSAAHRRASRRPLSVAGGE
jgi:hypothetical protein